MKAMRWDGASAKPDEEEKVFQRFLQTKVQSWGFFLSLVPALCGRGGKTPGQRGLDRDTNNNNIPYSSQREIKAVVRSHNEEHISSHL